METEKLSGFIDSVVEGAYRAGCFAKEQVQQILMMAEMTKQKIIEADKLATENLEMKIKIEVLENESKSLKNKFDELGIDLEEIKNPIDVNEIDIAENSVEDLSKAQNNLSKEISNHSQNGQPQKLESKKLEKDKK